MSQENSTNIDPCKTDDPNCRFAGVWFVGAIVFGIWFTNLLAHIDSKMYQTGKATAHAWDGGDPLDYTAFRDNRHAATSIASERIDERTEGGYTRVVEELKTEVK